MQVSFVNAIGETISVAEFVEPFYSLSKDQTLMVTMSEFSEGICLVVVRSESGWKDEKVAPCATSDVESESESESESERPLLLPASFGTDCAWCESGLEAFSR